MDAQNVVLTFDENGDSIQQFVWNTERGTDETRVYFVRRLSRRSYFTRHDRDTVDVIASGEERGVPFEDTHCYVLCENRGTHADLVTGGLTLDGMRSLIAARNARQQQPTTAE